MQLFPFLLPFSLLYSHVFHLSVDATFNPVTKPIISFCVGNEFVCAVFDTQQMKCWGYGGSFGSRSDFGDKPITIGDNITYFNPGTNLMITKVACRSSGICVLLETGKIKCAGSNLGGGAGIGFPTTTSQIGEVSKHVGDNLPPVNLGTDASIIDIVGGQYHTCALTAEFKLKCFGDNNFGQLGYGDIVDRGSSLSDMGSNLQYVNLGVDIMLASIHSGSQANHNCVTLTTSSNETQRVKCWGSNDYGQLGYGDKNDRGDSGGEMGDDLPLVDFGTESRAKQIALGQRHTCVLLVNNILKCLGEGYYGQLGSGSALDITKIGNSLPSVQIDSGKAIKLVTAGNRHTCILYDDMISMKCFGKNDNGELGQGDQIYRGDTITTMLKNITNINLGTDILKISSIHSSLSFNCVVLQDSSIKCFGKNLAGQFATGLTGIIGDEPGEMGADLEYANLFSPKGTANPTSAPNLAPTKPPVNGLVFALGVTIPVIVIWMGIFAFFVIRRKLKNKNKNMNLERPENLPSDEILPTAQVIEVADLSSEDARIPVATQTN